MKYWLLAPVALISFLAGHYLFPSKTPPVIVHNSIEKCEELLQFRPDFEAYQKLKIADERYRKADEILGKIMTVFLADLGLRMTTPVPAKADSTMHGVSDNREANQPAAKPVDNTRTAEAPKTTASRDWIRYEAQVKEQVSENEVKDILKKMEIKDLFAELKSAKPVSAAQFQIVAGRYIGEIIFFDDQVPWNIDWDFNGRVLGDGQIVGRQEISIRKNGKRFSHTTGEINAVMSMPGSEAILINVYGDDGYLQLYPNERLDHLYANYYQKKGLDQFTLKGVANLRRAP